MYMPNLTQRDAHRLWLDACDDDNFDGRSLQSLSSYTAAYPGSLNLHRIDQSKQQTIFRRINNSDKMDQSFNVENLIKYEYLNSFRSVGYNSLKPIGLDKTMKQLDEEKAELEELQRNNNNTMDFYGNEEEAGRAAAVAATTAASATAAATTMAIPAGSGSFDVSGAGNSAIQDYTGEQATTMTRVVSATTTDIEQSFAVLLADQSRSTHNNSSIAASSSMGENVRFHFQNDDDFMAEDEEYQDDHSISIDSDTSTRRVHHHQQSRILPRPAASSSFRRDFSNSSTTSTGEASRLRNEIRVTSSTEY